MQTTDAVAETSPLHLVLGSPALTMSEQTKKNEVRERLASLKTSHVFSGESFPTESQNSLAGEAEAVPAEEVEGRDTVSDHKT